MTSDDDYDLTPSSCALDKFFLLAGQIAMLLSTPIISLIAASRSTELHIISVRGRMTRHLLGYLAGISFDRWCIN